MDGCRHILSLDSHTEAARAMSTPQLRLQEAGFDDRLDMGPKEVHSGSFRFLARELSWVVLLL